MRKENRELLEEVLKDRLEVANQAEAGSEESTAALKEAMDIVDRIQKLDNNEIDKQRHIREEKAKAKTDKVMFWVHVGEIAATTVVVPTLYYVFNSGFARQVCEFEKDYSFTTGAGQAVRGLFSKKW